MNDYELLKISGGGVSGSILNAVSRLINTLLELGRAIGSSFRRIKTNNKC